MILVRTCGSGTTHNDERLQLLRNMIEYKIDNCSAKIFKLHDHKGLLSVYWFSEPDIHEISAVDECWSYLDTPDLINHYQVIISQKDLYIRL